MLENTSRRCTDVYDRQVDEPGKPFGTIRTSREGLSAGDLKVTVSAAPYGSRFEVIICIYDRERMKDKSDGEEGEPGWPGRRWGHNRTSSEGVANDRRVICSVRRVEWLCATESEREGEMSVEAGGQ